MSLYNLARQVQSKGRNGDTMLVHMTPGEVQGLQALALRHGGSLSINPETGLVEANILKKILPIAAGVALGPVGLGMSSAMAGLTVGGITALASGNLGKGLMAGLGAYGGAGLSGGLMAAGAPAASAAMSQGAIANAAEAAGTLGNQFAYNAAGEMVPANLAPSITGAAQGTQLMGTPTVGASVQEGFKAAAANPGAFFKENMFPIGATALSLMGDSTQQATIPPAQTGTIQPYTYSQTRNPEFGKVPGAPYFNQTFTPGTPYAAKEGGIIELAAGGRTGMFPQSMIDATQYATPSQMPASMEIIGSDYDTRVNPMTGVQDRGMAGGGIVALADGGQPPRVAPLTLAPNLGKYSQPAPAVNPAVTAYNQILADRAANEYVVQPPPLTMLPGGGERAGPADTQKLINQYYLSELGRQGDPEGLKYWAQRKIDTGESLADIKKQIGGSPEGQIYGLYRDVLGRRPDVEGASYWKGLLESGTSLDDIRKQFKASQEYQAKPAPVAAAPVTNRGGFTYDPLTGTYTRAPIPQPELGIDGFMSMAQDPAFQNYLTQMYQQHQQAQYSGGGKEGGLMPNNLEYAGGGISHLGDYSDGGRLLKGPGDGVSDSIPAQIGERQPARLADGEFVVPARIVSELGNGSTDAGARKLYAMMDRIQKKRKKSVGKDKVAVDTKSEGALPA